MLMDPPLQRSFCNRLFNLFISLCMSDILYLVGKPFGRGEGGGRGRGGELRQPVPVDI